MLESVFLICSAAEIGGSVVIILISWEFVRYSGRASFEKIKYPFFGIFPLTTLENNLATFMCCFFSLPSLAYSMTSAIL